MVAEEHGVRLQFHPHADSHVETREQVDRFLADTDPRTSRCAWTPGTSRTGARTALP